MLPGDRLFCVFVEPLKLGSQFTHWPLHVTVIAWLRLDVSDDALLQLVSQGLDAERFALETDGEAHFGHKGKLVSLIKQPTPLMGIEQILRKNLHEANAWLVDESTKRTFEYRPHVTAQGTKRLHRGDRFSCNAISLVKQYGEYKQVVGQIKL